LDLVGVGGVTYRCRNHKVEEPCTRHTTQHDTHACRKVLGNVVRVINHQRDNDSTRGLEQDRHPHDPIVACEEACLLDGVAFFPDDAEEQRGEERPEGELAVAHPQRRGLRGRRVFENLFKGHACEAREGAGDEDGEEADAAVHLGWAGSGLGLYAFISCGAHELVGGHTTEFANVLEGAGPEFGVGWDGRGDMLGYLND
jgi:hypothetical protein